MDMFADHVDIEEITQKQEQRDWAAQKTNPTLRHEVVDEVPGPHVSISAEQLRDVLSIRLDAPPANLADADDIVAEESLVKKATRLTRGKTPRRRMKSCIGETGTTEAVAPLPDLARTESVVFEEVDQKELLEQQGAKHRDSLTRYITQHRAGSTIVVDPRSAQMRFNPQAAAQMRYDAMHGALVARNKEVGRRMTHMAQNVQSAGLNVFERSINMLLQFFRHSNTAPGSMVKKRIYNPKTKKHVWRTMPVDHAYLLLHKQPSIHPLERRFEEEVLLRTPRPELGERPCKNGNKCEGLRVARDDCSVLREIVYPEEHEWHMRSPGRSQWKHLATDPPAPRRRCLMCERRAVGIAWGQALASNMDVCDRGVYITNICNIVNMPNEYDLMDVYSCTTNFTGLYAPVVRHDRWSYVVEKGTVPGTQYEATYFRQKNFRGQKSQPQLPFCREPFQ
jgi:hypothetical protein